MWRLDQQSFASQLNGLRSSGVRLWQWPEWRWAAGLFLVLTVWLLFRLHGVVWLMSAGWLQAWLGLKWLVSWSVAWWLGWSFVWIERWFIAWWQSSAQQRQRLIHYLVSGQWSLLGQELASVKVVWLRSVVIQVILLAVLFYQVMSGFDWWSVGLLAGLLAEIYLQQIQEFIKQGRLSQDWFWQLQFYPTLNYQLAYLLIFASLYLSAFVIRS